MVTQTEIRQRITQQIIDALEGGKLPPWRRPWLASQNAGLATNIVSNRRYSGINPLLLEIAAQRHDFRSKWWGTFKQWERLGGRVMRRPTHVSAGQWGTSIVFWKPVTKTKIAPDTDEEEEVKFGFLKSFTVFNADQVEGEFLDRFRVTDCISNKSFVDYEPAERAIADTKADIRFGGEQAFYRRPVVDNDSDFIQMPHKYTFTPSQEYYGTLLHELMHWTECRLGWQGSYAEGELRAEIGACYALAELGVPQSDDLINHHAYLKHWLENLRRDPRFIFSVATAASKAVDFVLSSSRKAEWVSDESCVIVI